MACPELSRYICCCLHPQTVNITDVDISSDIKMHPSNELTLTKKCLATLDGEIADPEITVKLEMRDVLILHDEET